MFFCLQVNQDVQDYPDQQVNDKINQKGYDRNP